MPGSKGECTEVKADLAAAAPDDATVGRAGGAITGSRYAEVMDARVEFKDTREAFIAGGESARRTAEERGGR